MTERRYSEEEVRTILEMALKKDADQGVAHDELVAAAAEVGITRDAIDRAAQDLDEVRVERDARRMILMRRRRCLMAHVWPFVAVNGFLWAINMLTTPHFPWFLFPLLGWGLGLFFHARAGLSKEISQKELAREYKRNAKLARQERREKSVKELSAVLDKGVDQLLSQLANEVRGGGKRIAEESKGKVDRQRIEVHEERLDDLEHEEPSEPRARRSR